MLLYDLNAFIIQLYYRYRTIHAITNHNIHIKTSAHRISNGNYIAHYLTNYNVLL